MADRQAEQQAARGDPDGSERPRGRTARGGQDGRARPARRSEGRLTAGEAAQRGLRQVAELTGRTPDGVTSVEPADHGWTVGVEVVEDRRIPSSTDVLAIYQAELDDSGELISYRRMRRYSRGKSDSSDGSEGW